MQLQLQLKTGAALLLAVAAGVSTYVFLGYADAYRQSAQNLQTLTSYDLVLKAGNAVSAERAPSNILLSLDPDAGQAYVSMQADVAAARQRTDLALSDLQNLVAKQPHDGQTMIELAAARKSLAQGRADIDCLARHAPSDRSPQDLQNAIDAMIDARTRLDPVIQNFYGAALRHAPDQAGIMQGALILSDLREFGGRIGSMLIVPLSTPEPISPARRAVIIDLKGHIDQLHRLLPGRVDPASQGRDDIDGMRARLERGFFGHMLSLIDQLVAHSGSDYGLRAASFTRQVLPDLMDLERLEDLFMHRAIAQIAQTHRDARRQMLLTGACLLALFCFLVAALRAAESLIIRPLLLARQEIINLASGHLSRTPRAGRSAEVRALHDAIDTLRRHQILTTQLALERDHLSEALREQAYTDALTGLLNRRALEEVVGDLSAAPVVLREDRGLILLDVDYFKPINDEHGHVVGDIVLRAMADRIKDVVPPPHRAFRYGGEEFAVLTAGLSMKALCALAESIRRAIAGHEVLVHNALSLPVTASFGVARGEAGQSTWLNLLKAADTALYQAKAKGRNQLIAADSVS
ncbi:GGDEF domain-containing protein [Dyella psychrodurans]|nr:GGDEF domain-containing protein [Dyella psychrodurans]